MTRGATADVIVIGLGLTPATAVWAIVGVLVGVVATGAIAYAKLRRSRRLIEAAESRRENEERRFQLSSKQMRVRLRQYEEKLRELEALRRDRLAFQNESEHAHRTVEDLHEALEAMRAAGRESETTLRSALEQERSHAALRAEIAAEDLAAARRATEDVRAELVMVREDSEQALRRLESELAATRDKLRRLSTSADSSRVVAGEARRELEEMLRAVSAERRRLDEEKRRLESERDTLQHDASARVRELEQALAGLRTAHDEVAAERDAHAAEAAAQARRTDEGRAELERARVELAARLREERAAASDLLSRVVNYLHETPAPSHPAGRVIERTVPLPGGMSEVSGEEPRPADLPAEPREESGAGPGESQPQAEGEVPDEVATGPEAAAPGGGASETEQPTGPQSQGEQSEQGEPDGEENGEARTAEHADSESPSAEAEAPDDEAQREGRESSVEFETQVPIAVEEAALGLLAALGKQASAAAGNRAEAARLAEERDAGAGDPEAAPGGQGGPSESEEPGRVPAQTGAGAPADIKQPSDVYEGVVGPNVKVTVHQLQTKLRRPVTAMQRDDDVLVICDDGSVWRKEATGWVPEPPLPGSATEMSHRFLEDVPARSTGESESSSGRREPG